MTPEEYQNWEELLLNEILSTCGRYKEEVGLTRCHISGILELAKLNMLDPTVVFEADMEDDDDES